jgi:hypothetical protein
VLDVNIGDDFPGLLHKKTYNYVSDFEWLRNYDLLTLRRESEVY